MSEIAWIDAGGAAPIRAPPCDEAIRPLAHTAAEAAHIRSQIDRLVSNRGPVDRPWSKGGHAS